MLEHAERHAIHTRAGEVGAQGGIVGHLGTVRQPGAGFLMLSAEETGGIELLQRQAPRINARVTTGTAFVVAVQGEAPRPQRLCQLSRGH